MAYFTTLSDYSHFHLDKIYRLDINYAINKAPFQQGGIHQCMCGATRYRALNVGYIIIIVTERAEAYKNK